MVGKLIYIVTALICLSGCTDQRHSVKYDKFELFPSIVESKVQNPIRHHGIYYQNYSSANLGNDTYEGDRMRIRIFFDDGTFLNFSQHQSQVHSEKYPCVIIPQDERDFILHWGIYHQIGDTLVVQKIHPQRGLFKKFDKEELIAIVGNDSITFIEKRMPKKSTLNLNESYTFMSCDSMPASDNIFLQNLRESSKSK